MPSPLLSRRAALSSLTAAGALTAVRAAAAARPLRVTLLGQCLIQHDLCAQDWPDAPAFARMFAEADVCFSDLETAIRTPLADAATRDGQFLHAADPAVIDCLKRLNINILATSNNHAFDLGAGGVIGVTQALDARGLTHAGSGRDLAEAAAPAYRRTAGGSVALVAMATGAIREGAAATPDHPGVNEVRRGPDGRLDETDLSRVLTAVSQAARRADVVILYHHNHFWEPDMAQTPDWQKALARRAVDAGAHVFASHGAPLMQGIEIYRGRPIFYDLGGFMFQTVTPPGKYPPAVWRSVIAECEFAAGKLAGLTLTPVQLTEQGLGGPQDFATRGRPSLAHGAQATAILDDIERMSAPLGARFRRDGERARLTIA